VDEDEDEISIKEVILKRIRRFKKKLSSLNLYTEADPFRLRRACKYLAAALVIALWPI
jgi:hypothetical protein